MAGQHFLEGPNGLMLQPITAVNGEPMCATAVVCQAVSIQESAGMKGSHAINLVMADIANYNLILCMVWLHKQNPDSQ
jgi:hypothetical protein